MRLLSNILKYIEAFLPNTLIFFKANLGSLVLMPQLYLAATI